MSCPCLTGRLVSSLPAAPETELSSQEPEVLPLRAFAHASLAGLTSVAPGRWHIHPSQP